MRRRPARGAQTLSALWLDRVDAGPDQRDVVARDVQVRLKGLPSVLRLMVRPVEVGLGVLPEAAIRSIRRWPGFSEYARLVESLTAVAYFDLESPAGARVPQQRTPGLPAPAEQV